jgi:hypothetical protein
MSYISVGLLLYLIAFIALYKKNIYISNLVNKFIILIIVLMYGLRYEVGSDWFEYVKYFSVFEEGNIDLSSIYELGFSFGLAYPAVIKLLTDLGLGFSIYLILHGLLLFGCTYFALSNFVQKNEVAFLIVSIFISTIGCWGSDRQLMGLSIVLVALVPLYRGRYFQFLVLILIASLFHSYNLLFLSFILHVFIKPKYKYIIILLIIPFIINLLFKVLNIDNPIYLLSNIDNNINRYLNEEILSSSSNLSLIIKISLIVPGLILIKALKNNEEFLFLYKLNIILIFILIISFFFFSPIYQRSLYINNFFDILIIYYTIKIFFTRFQVLIYPALIAFSFIKGYRSILYAYEMFIPYNSIIYLN